MKYGYKITIIVLASLIKLSSLWGQTDAATLKISYKAAFKSCVERPQLYDEMTLLIGAHSSCFYSVTNKEQQQALDSVVRATGGNLSQFLYLQPIITQYFIDNKSEIWLLFLIAHSKR
ncbi:hypothetical protein [Bacteroides heparinolyticus]|uniref:hypothetical protein n=1 Tax=Prevotella heparinolytica TaxID=28113 RepID=UPI00359F400F